MTTTTTPNVPLPPHMTPVTGWLDWDGNGTVARGIKGARTTIAKSARRGRGLGDYGVFVVCVMPPPPPLGPPPPLCGSAP